tara:strand:- start:2463 stop:3182 length:720 start_codon:yes stop_codon:yes gene_type:complete
MCKAGEGRKIYDDTKLVKIEMRSTCVSARDIGVLLGISPFQTQLEGLFEKCGYRRWRPFTPSMRRGVDQEKEAIQAYVEKENIDINEITYPGFKRHDQYNHIGGVPDGIRNNEILVEVKCPERFSRGETPPEFYVTQIQAYMQIFNLNIAHYVEYIRTKGVRILEVKRDDEWWKKILPLVRNYWDEILYWRTNDIHNHPKFPGCQCENCLVCKKLKRKKNKKVNNYENFKCNHKKIYSK